MMKRFLSGVLAAAVVVSGAAFTTTSADAASVPKAAYTFNMNKANKKVVAVARKGEDSKALTAKGVWPTEKQAKSKKVTLKYVKGKHGKGLSLDRTQKGTGYGAQLKGVNLGSGSWSVSFWVKAGAAMSQYMPVFFTASDITEKGAKWLSITKTNEWLGGGANPIIWSRNATIKNAFPWYANNEWTAVEAIVPNKWVHVVLTVNSKKTIWYAEDDKEIKYKGLHGNTYINGKLWGNGAVAKGSMSSKNKFFLGINAWDVPFKGVIDDVQFYKSALNAKQVKALYKKQK